MGSIFMPPFPPSYPRAHIDTPMSDAPFRAAPSAAQNRQHHGSGHSGDGTNLPEVSQHQKHTPQTTTAQEQQQPAPEPPRSPQLRGVQTQETPNPNLSHYSQTSMQKQQLPPQPSPASSARSQANAASPKRIKVRSLSHIQTFATDESSPFSPSYRRADGDDVVPQYEISEMPVTDIIEMVAGLLTKITTTNDRQHEHLHRQIPPPEGATSMSPQTSSVLAFHGKNIPSITILSYLSRIHKYCPTTYEVFLSLLVYFDRMTERVNSGPLQSLRQANQQSLEMAASRQPGSRRGSGHSTHIPQPSPAASSHSQAQAHTATPPPSGSLGMPTPSGASVDDQRPPSPPMPIDSPVEADPYSLSHFFVVDSFNIHRLVIAGVTCASKFFSDIFYTNSRYAKVGGLPLPELNHLELQFLLLNDFRLTVPLEEMEAYATMLVEFYAREVIAQKQQSQSVQ